MRVIDLTQSLYDHMPVYPGDPEVVIQQIHTLEKEGWHLRLLTLSTHIGTHVNAPIHMTKNGKTLDEISLDHFMGPCVLYEEGMKFEKETGVIFSQKNIDRSIADQLIKTPPKFIGLSDMFEFDIDLEKLLLEHDIISYENLANTDQLPESFQFYGFPLRIQEADGSPVRAIALVD